MDVAILQPDGEDSKCQFFFTTSVQQSGLGVEDYLLSVCSCHTGAVSGSLLNSHWDYILPKHTGACKRHQTYCCTNR